MYQLTKKYVMKLKDVLNGRHEHMRQCGLMDGPSWLIFILHIHLHVLHTIPKSQTILK